jgi:hypothetical protein
LLPSIVLTTIGSGLGAFLLLTVPLKALQLIIAVAMIAVAVFSLLNKNLGQASHDAPASWGGALTGYAATFLLAIYGGFFSGGYVTMLTAAFVVFFGMTFLQAVATTKVINVFSSGIATVVFVWRGVVDLKLGIILGIAMFLGALLGGRIALLLEHGLAAADLHSGSAWPCSQDAVALALGNGRDSGTDTSIISSRRAHVGCVPCMVILDLKMEKVMDCFQRLRVCCLNSHPAPLPNLFKAVRNFGAFLLHHRNAGRDLVVD